MLSKCAAPGCGAAFRYLHSGRLFQFERREITASPPDRIPPRSLEFFWLCEKCASRFRLVADATTGVRVVPLARIGASAA